MLDSENVQFIHFGLSVAMFPSIDLSRELQHRFQSKLEAEKIPFSETRFSKENILCTSGDEQTNLSIQLSRDRVMVEYDFPQESMDYFLRLSPAIVQAAIEIGNFRVSPQITGLVRGEMQCGEDARVLLGEKVLGLGDKVKSFKRPLHLVGLRFFFPALGEPGKPPVRPDQINLKIESRLTKAKCLFFECEYLKALVTQRESIVSESEKCVKGAAEFLKGEALNFVNFGLSGKEE